jgi:hypothetical protein
MTTGNIPTEAPPDLPYHGTLTEPSETDLFHRCWGRQNCDLCISSHDPCAWCAISQTYVPNIDHGTLMPFLITLRKENICLLGWQERWKLHTKTFGRLSSTMTFMSVMIAVLSSMIGVLLIWAAVKLGGWSVRRWKSIEERGGGRSNPSKSMCPISCNGGRNQLCSNSRHRVANTERRRLFG